MVLGEQSDIGDTLFILLTLEQPDVVIYVWHFIAHLRGVTARGAAEAGEARWGRTEKTC